MRDKLEFLPLSVLKDIAKDNQVKHYSTMKKAELIDILVKLSELEAADEEKVEADTDTPKVSATATWSSFFNMENSSHTNPKDRTFTKTHIGI